MKKKVYYSASCSTCLRIMKEVGVDDTFDKQNIKTEGISKEQLAEMKQLSGSYESLFSRRAMKYRKMGLHEQTLTEADYERLITEEYTFLKRPVFLIGAEIFVGNGKKTVAAVKDKITVIG